MKRLNRRVFLRGAAGLGVSLSVAGSGCIGGGGFDGTVTFGSVLPMSGRMKSYGPGMKQGAEMAVKDVNDGGGINGKKLEVDFRDTGTEASKAVKELNSLASKKDIQGLIGAGSSHVSVRLAKKVPKKEIMCVSPASTSPKLSNIGYKDGEKYFGRTSPSDGLQALITSQTLNKQEFIGAETASFIYVNNPYGKGLAKEAEKNFLGETKAMIPYSLENKANHEKVLKKAYENNPDAVGLVAYPKNGRKFINAREKQGYSGDMVLSESLKTDDFINPLGSKVEGMYLVAPDPKDTAGADKFEKRVDGSEVSLFSKYSYDALMLMALAAQKAGKTTGTAISNNLQSVSEEPGTKVTVGEFGKAKNELEKGNDVNYQGASGEVNMNEKLEPLSPFAIYQVQNGKLEKKKHVPVV